LASARKGRHPRRNLSYKELAERLEAIGVKDNERDISNNINRGTFSAVFLAQCLEAIGCCHMVHLDGY
jgi:3-mercaptopyruvate sulfurtransferase SseA